VRIPRQREIVALGWLSRLLAMGVSLAVVRIALRILGEADFAVFQILTASLAWLSLSSLGLGPALKNLVSECRARGEPDTPLREASVLAIVLLLAIGTLLVVAAAPVVSGGLLRKLEHDPLWSYRALLVGGLLTIVASLGQVSMEVLYAEFRAKWVYILSIIASALTLVLLMRIVQLRRPPAELLFWVVSATTVPPAVSGLIALRITRLLDFRLALPDRDAVTRLARLAMRFWLFALLSSLILMVDYLVISQILVAREIVLYTIMMKIITVALALFTTILAVLWPEWTHNWELRQWQALRKRVLSLALAGVTLCVPGAFVAVFLFPVVIRLWLHDATVVPSTLLILEFVAYLAIRIWTDVHSTALMSGSRVFVATRFAAVQALITAPLEFLFGRQWGAEGVIFGLVAGFLLTAAWLFPRRFYGEVRTGSLQDAGMA
jgi:O-antigen/teichoic acid export membrane protein